MVICDLGLGPLNFAFYQKFVMQYIIKCLNTRSNTSLFKYVLIKLFKKIKSLKNVIFHFQKEMFELRYILLLKRINSRFAIFPNNQITYILQCHFVGQSYRRLSKKTVH